MMLPWKEFQIDLVSFNLFLKSDVIKADGIVATIEQFEVIEVSPFEESDIQLVQNYYDSLTEQGELDKIANRQEILEELTEINIPESLSSDQAAQLINELDNVKSLLQAYLGA